MNFVAALWAIAIAIAQGPRADRGTWVGAPTLLSIVLFVMAVVGIVGRASPLLSILDFAFAIAFGLLAWGAAQSDNLKRVVETASVPQSERAWRWRLSGLGAYSPLLEGTDLLCETRANPDPIERTDQEIENEVRDILQREAQSSPSETLSAKVMGQEVYLEGQVLTRRARRLVEAMIDAVPGVRDIHNDIQVDARSRGTRAA